VAFGFDLGRRKAFRVGSKKGSVTESIPAEARPKSRAKSLSGERRRRGLKEKDSVGNGIGADLKSLMASY